MAVANKMELGRELFKTISQIQQQIDEIKAEAKIQGIEAVKMRDITGNWALTPLLAGKAQCLHALAIINQRD
jgi:hypothetical protein